MKKHHISSVILAGGRSSRMGTNKAFVHYRGQPLISYALTLAGSLGNPIYISGSIVDYQHLGPPVIEDRLKEKGPLGALDAILRTLTDDFVLLIPCDSPNLDAVTYARLIAEARSPATVARDPERIHPLVGLYHRSCLVDVEDALNTGRLSISALLERIGGHSVEFDDITPFININHPHQLRS